MRTSTATGITSRHLCSEVYVTRRVDQMEHVVQALVVVQHSTRLSLDGDASFSLDIELVQDLSISTLFDDSGQLEQAIAQGALSVIDVGDNAEVAKAVYGNGGDALLQLRLRLDGLRQAEGCRVEMAGIVDQRRIEAARY